jgi:nucleoside phosphorylase
MNSPKIKQLEEIRGQVDFGIITMREDEFKAVLNRFKPQWLVIGKAQYNVAFLKTRLGNSLCVAIMRTVAQGLSAAQTAATALHSDLDPSCFVLVGIAGAKPEPEFTLGDVIVATRFYDFSVTAALAGGKIETTNAGAPMHQLVQTAAANLPALEECLGDWNTDAAIGLSLPPVVLDKKNFVGDKAWREKTRLSLSEQFHSAGPQRKRVVTTGALASGNVLMKDPTKFQRLLDNARDVKGTEMELSGVFEAVRSSTGDRPVIPIRGFSDVIGFKRDAAWTEYACQASASFTRAFLAAEILNIEPKTKPRAKATEKDTDGRYAGMSDLYQSFRTEWVPVLRGRAEGTVVLVDAIGWLLRSLSPAFKPQWIGVLHKYATNNHLPDHLTEESEDSLRQLRNVGLISHDGPHLLTPVRSKKVWPTPAGLLLIALHFGDTPSIQEQIAREIGQQLSTVTEDPKAIALLQKIQSGGSIASNETDAFRELRNLNLVTHLEKHLVSAEKLALTALGNYILQNSGPLQQQAPSRGELWRARTANRKPELTFAPVNGVNFVRLGTQNHIANAQFTVSIRLNLLSAGNPFVLMGFCADYIAKDGCYCLNGDQELSVGDEKAPTAGNYLDFKAPMQIQNGIVQVSCGRRVRPPLMIQSPIDCDNGDIRVRASILWNGAIGSPELIERFFRFEGYGGLTAIDHPREPPILSDSVIATMLAKGLISTEEFERANQIDAVERYQMVCFGDYKKDVLTRDKMLRTVTPEFRAFLVELNRRRLLEENRE